MRKTQRQGQTQVGRISIEGEIPPIQAAFRFLPGGGARVTIDLTPDSANKYFQYIQLADRSQLLVVGELGLRQPETVGAGKPEGEYALPSYEVEDYGK